MASSTEETLDVLRGLVESFKLLPGIGEKTATRLTYFILRQPKSVAQSLAESLISARNLLHTCQECCNFSETPTCGICADPQRQNSILCVVEQPSDLAALERSRHYQGKYHVLHGILSPLDGVDESKIKVKELVDRVKSGGVQEVILATNPTVEGDTTALYIARLIKYNGVKVSRIAHGIPVGSEIEYLDSATLSKALQNRVAL